MTATTAKNTTGVVRWIRDWTARKVGLLNAMDRAEQEAQELTERWDVPKGDHIPADLQDTQPRYWLTRSGQQIAGRLDVNDLAEGSQSAAAPVLLALFPVLAVLAFLLSTIAPWLGILPLVLVVPLAVVTWQATNSALWPLLVVGVGVVMPLLGSSTGFGMSMRDPMDLFAFVATLGLVTLAGGFMAQSYMAGVRNGLLIVGAFVGANVASMWLPVYLGQAAWFAVGCLMPLMYAHTIAKARAGSLLVDAHTHMSEVHAGHATAHVGARQQLLPGERRRVLCHPQGLGHAAESQGPGPGQARCRH